MKLLFKIICWPFALVWNNLSDIFVVGMMVLLVCGMVGAIRNQPPEAIPVYEKGDVLHLRLTDDPVMVLWSNCGTQCWYRIRLKDGKTTDVSEFEVRR